MEPEDIQYAHICVLKNIGKLNARGALNIAIETHVICLNWTMDISNLRGITRR
jgi:hypothetical protein